MLSWLVWATLLTNSPVTIPPAISCVDGLFVDRGLDGSVIDGSFVDEPFAGPRILDQPRLRPMAVQDDSKDGKDKAKGDEPKLAWSKDEGATLFAEARKLFDEEKFTEADEKFKAARKVAKGRKTKAYVNLWRAGAQGGIRLAVLKDQKEKNPRGAFRQAEGLYNKTYRETPIAAAYTEFMESLRDELFYSLENFDTKSKRYSEKFGKTFVDDPEFVKQGRRALRWETINHPATLKIERIPKNLSKYKAVSFWINFPKGGMNYWVVFKGKGKGAAGGTTGRITDNTFSVQRKYKKGWHRVEVPFKDFTQYGLAKWSDIVDFRIYFDQKRKIVLYIDDVNLVK